MRDPLFRAIAAMAGLYGAVNACIYPYLSLIAVERVGISDATLHKWRAEARGKGQLLPDADAGPEGWTSRDKFAAVLETAALNEADLAEYCRKRGLYPAQIAAWRSACEQANDWDRASSARLGRATKEEKKRVKELERELARKDRALAETAALLVLRKKAAAIWGDGEDA
jgi:transposase-like protein